MKLIDKVRVLIDSDISGYKIAKGTGIDSACISQVRNQQLMRNKVS